MTGGFDLCTGSAVELCGLCTLYVVMYVEAETVTDFGLLYLKKGKIQLTGITEVQTVVNPIGQSPPKCMNMKKFGRGGGIRGAPLRSAKVKRRKLVRNTFHSIPGQVVTFKVPYLILTESKYLTAY